MVFELGLAEDTEEIKWLEQTTQNNLFNLDILSVLLQVTPYFLNEMRFK